MTVREAIDLADLLKVNAYSDERKRLWLSQLDGRIHREIILQHAHTAQEAAFDGYQDEEQTLLVPFPYAESVYNNYLQAMIDRENGEIGKYNQSIALFESAYLEYACWYNRTHCPLYAGGFRY